MYEFLVTDDFIKDLENLEENNQELVRKKLKYLENQENPLLLSKKLKGYKNIFRFRSGVYRIIFKLDYDKIILLKVRNRKEIYRNI